MDKALLKEIKKVEEGEVGESYAEKVRNSEAFKEFHQEFDETVSLMQSVFSDFASNEVTMDAVNQVVDEAITIIAADQKEFNVFDIVHNMRQSSDITYAHSINVAMICHTIAKWVGMSDEEATMAFTCGILHDIGKLRVPAEIINKTDKLTKEEYEILYVLWKEREGSSASSSGT